MKKKILVVDDNHLILKFITNLLVKRGHTVKAAEDGISALSVLDDYTPDIIFLDVFMPNVDGARLCKIIKNVDRLSSSQVVIVSSAVSELQSNFSDIPADGYIPKESFRRMGPKILEVVDQPQENWKGILLQPPGEEITEEEDISPRQITKELLAINRHLETVLASMSDGVIEICDGRIVFVNQAAISLFGLPEETMLGKNPTDFFEKSARTAIEQILSENAAETVEIEKMTPLHLAERQVQVNKIPLQGESSSSILIFSDVTERTKFLQRIVLSERLSSAGQLSSAIANEINSPLQAVTSTLSHMKRTYPDDQELQENIDLLNDAFERIRSTAKNLMEVNRPDYGMRHTVNVNDIVSGTISVIKNYLKKNKCHISFDSDPGLPRIKASPRQLEQVLLQLINNSVDAANGVYSGTQPFSDTEAGGDIGITTRSNGNTIHILYRDRGPGLPDPASETIFKLFYSRKKENGTGIGLTVCRQIIEEHGGEITAENRSGGGALFTITLPV